MSALTTGINRMNAYQIQTVFASTQGSYGAGRDPDADKQSGSGPAVKLELSAEAQGLQQKYARKRDELEQKFAVEKRNLEAEYRQQKQELEQEYRRKNSSLGLNIYI